MNTARQYLGQWGVIPTFSDLFGRQPSLDELLAIVRRYPVTEWLSYLSRIQNLLSADSVGEAENVERVRQGVVPHHIRQRLDEWERRGHHGASVHLFYERQLTTLQQLALLHAPEGEAPKFDTDRGRDDLCCALFMTLDLMNSGRQMNGSREATLACLVQDQIRMSAIPAGQYAARALWFYELDRGERSQHVCAYLSLFGHAAGVNARDAILGGLCAEVRERTLDPNTVAERWSPFLRAKQCPKARERECIEAYERIRLRSLAEVRELVQRLDGDKPIRGWNLIAMSQAPLIDLGPVGAFVVNHTALGRSLFDGIRHTVLTAALNHGLPDPFNNEAAVGDVYGRVFASYVQRVFETAFPGRVVNLDGIVSQSDQHADLVIWFPDKVLVVEIKGAHFLGLRHASFLSLDERRTELEKIDIAKAIRQLSGTIQALRAGGLRVSEMPAYDWTCTPIIPLVVTEERTPQVVGCWGHLYEPLCGPLRALGVGAGLVGRLRILCIDEAEDIPDVAAEHDLAALLYQWGMNNELYELPWSSFLEVRGIHPSGDFIRGRLGEVVQLLAARVGLDPKALTLPKADLQ